jgi:CBS domain-containing protein/SAM-dependent methyltransferase
VARVRDAVSHRSPRLTPDTTVATAADELWRGGWIPLPVLDQEGRVLAAVSATDLVRSVAKRQDANTTPVTEVAATELPAVAPDDTLESAREAMQRTGQPLVLVVEDSRLIGIVTVSDLEGHELVQQELGPDAARVNTEVSPNDLMYSGSWGAYAYAGVTAVQCIREILQKLERPDPERILDLPCGHGRELRFLEVAYPKAGFTVCDLDEDGVEFCARVFDADPVVSHEDPGQVTFDHKHDLAWSGSLFTHLSADRWPGFLDLFARALEPGGLALFSTNAYLPASILQDLGLSAAQAEQLLADFQQKRFGYVDAGSGSWGLSLARPRWAIEQVERSPLELVSYEQRAWKPPAPAQDVLVCRLP